MCSQGAGAPPAGAAAAGWPPYSAALGAASTAVPAMAPPMQGPASPVVAGAEPPRSYTATSEAPAVPTEVSPSAAGMTTKPYGADFGWISVGLERPPHAAVRMGEVSPMGGVLQQNPAAQGALPRLVVSLRGRRRRRFRCQSAPRARCRAPLIWRRRQRPTAQGRSSSVATTATDASQATPEWTARSEPPVGQTRRCRKGGEEFRKRAMKLYRIDPLAAVLDPYSRARRSAARTLRV